MIRAGDIPSDIDMGRRMHTLIAELYPICRSITGDGVRKTLAVLQKHIPLEVREVPSGTAVFDWTVPREWNCREAWIKDPTGRKIVDFANHNLHVMSYSVPVRAKLPLAELKTHLFSLPDQPERIPYRTSYYSEAWAFCLPHRQLQQLTDGEYQVLIDSTLAAGSLTYGECVLPGETGDEVLISCHVCHPSLCNDNLSGAALATFLAHALMPLKRRYTYRFLFIPGTIGSITWLALNEEKTERIRHGLVVTCVGDPGQFTYKKSRRGNAEIDQAVTHVLERSGQPFKVQDFSPYGYDERQYCSPGFDLPVGSLMRTPNGCYPEYHTSADNLDLVTPEALAGSLRAYANVVSVLEGNRVYLNQNPKCEPQLGKRGLYNAVGGQPAPPGWQMAMLWVLNLSDGGCSLLEIAERAQIPFELIERATSALVEKKLLAPMRQE